jgi:hypothetical protein
MRLSSVAIDSIQGPDMAHEAELHLAASKVAAAPGTGCDGQVHPLLLELQHMSASQPGPDSRIPALVSLQYTDPMEQQAMKAASMRAGVSGENRPAGAVDDLLCGGDRCECVWGGGRGQEALQHTAKCLISHFVVVACIRILESTVESAHSVFWQGAMTTAVVSFASSTYRFLRLECSPDGAVVTAQLVPRLQLHEPHLQPASGQQQHGQYIRGWSLVATKHSLQARGTGGTAGHAAAGA